MGDDFNMAKIVINDTTGGLSTLPPTTLLPNQVSSAENCEWYETTCGERRLGNVAVTLDGGALDACDRIVWMHRHLPGSDEVDAQLWVLGIDGSTPVLRYKTTTWTTVTMPDAMVVNGVAEYSICGLSFHGKLFIAYRSAVDRLHVFIQGDTALRRTGIAAAAAPTAANGGGAGTISKVRYYRVRFTEQISGTTVRRSEPSPVLTFTPGGANANVTVTKPTSPGEGETHWELEASDDNGTFYRIATTVVGTTTYADTTADTVLYSTIGTLSEDIGDYDLIPSARYLAAIEDRIMWASTFAPAFDTTTARVGWTPVGRASGVGNDERMERDNEPFVDLDAIVGGSITGLSQVVNGYVYVTKLSHVYQGVQTRNNLRSFQFILLTNKRGALPGTLVEGLDNNDNPSLFALDRDVGPIRLGSVRGGVETCGGDLVQVWRNYKSTVVSNTNLRAQTAIFYPLKRQVRFYLRGTSTVLVLHTRFMKSTDDGFRGGWAVWQQAAPTHMAILYADNIEDNTSRSRILVPLTAHELTATLVWRGESGDVDIATGYTGQITTQQYTPSQYQDEFEVKGATVFGAAKAGLYFGLRVFGRRANKLPAGRPETSLDFAPNAGEVAQFYDVNARAIRYAESDQVGVSELNTVSVQYGDDTTIAATTRKQWAIDTIVLPVSSGQKRGS